MVCHKLSQLPGTASCCLPRILTACFCKCCVGEEMEITDQSIIVSFFFFSPNSTLNNNNITRIPVTSFNHMPKIRTLWVGSSVITMPSWCCKATLWLFVICDNVISVSQAASGLWSPWGAQVGLWRGLVPTEPWVPLFWICPALSKSQFYQDLEFTWEIKWHLFFPRGKIHNVKCVPSWSISKIIKMLRWIKLLNC